MTSYLSESMRPARTAAGRKPAGIAERRCCGAVTLCVFMVLSAAVSAGLPEDFPVTDGLVLLFDGDAVEIEEDRVVRMVDLSGGGNHAEADWESAPLAVPEATPSRRGAVRFDGESRYLEVPANPGDFDGPGMTSLAVFRADTFGLRRMINLSYATLDRDNPSAPGRPSAHSVYTHISGAVRVENRAADGTSIAVSTDGGSVTLNEFHLGGNLWRTDGETIAITVDGRGNRSVGTTTGADANPGGHERTRIGAGGGVDPNNHFAGELAAVAHFNRELDHNELSLVEEYLIKRYLHPVDPWTEYFEWAASFGLEGEPAAPEADPNRDGVTNLEKFAFGLNPLENRRASIPAGWIETLDGAETFLFSMPRNRSVDAIVEASPGLVNWSSRPADFIIHRSGHDELTVRLPYAARETGPRFVRASLALKGDRKWLELGRRGFATETVTGESPNSVPPGTPVVSMWEAAYVREGEPAGGLPIVEDARHRAVWRPQEREEGAFNHHAALGRHDGRFLAMWSNHPLGEDASGQRVLYSESPNGGFWEEPRELFPAPDEIRDRGEPGVTLRPDRWVVVGDRCYAVAYSRTQGTPNSSFPVAREVSSDGTLGAPFTLHPEDRTELLPVYMRDSEPYGNPEAAEAILGWYRENEVVSWWAQFGEGVPRNGIDGANLIEPLTYRAADGEVILLMRFHPRGADLRHNNRMYVSFRDRDGEWAVPYPTDIPDSPSRTEPIVLPDGTVLLVGNQIAPELDDGRYLFRDPLTVAVSRDGYIFDRVYSVRHDAPTEYRFDGIGGRTGGFAYSSSLVHDGWLYTLYSVGKEDIEITRVPLRVLGL